MARLGGGEVTHHKGQGGQRGEEVLAHHAMEDHSEACQVPRLVLVTGSLGSVACGPDSQPLEAWKYGLKII